MTFLFFDHGFKFINQICVAAEHHGIISQQVPRPIKHDSLDFTLCAVLLARRCHRQKKELVVKNTKNDVDNTQIPVFRTTC